MFLPRFSTRTALIILAVAAVLFAILSQGLLGVQDRWQSERDENFDQSPFVRGGDVVSTWRQVCAGLSVAAVALAVLMTINGLFFVAAWLAGFGGRNPEAIEALSVHAISPPPPSTVVGRVSSASPSGERTPPSASSLPASQTESVSLPNPAGPPTHD